MIRFWLILIWCFCVQTVIGQQVKQNNEYTVRGAVFDQPREAVISGSVVVKLAIDSSFVKGVSTKEDGTYAIRLKEENYIFEYSYLGYNTSVVKNI